MRIKDKLNSIRGLTALLVVSVHLSAKGKGLFVLELIHHSAVPIFFFISGYFNLKRDRSIVDYYNGKLRTIKIIIAWGILYILWRQFAFEESMDISDVLTPFITGTYPYYHLWFLYYLIPMYVITPLLRNDKVNLIILILSFCVSLFYYGSFVYWLFIYSLGILVKKNSDFIESRPFTIGIELGVLSSSLLLLIFDNPFTRDIGTFGMLLVTVKYLKVITPTLTRHSLGIYLLHPLIIDIYMKLESMWLFDLPSVVDFGIIGVLSLLSSITIKITPTVRSLL